MAANDMRSCKTCGTKYKYCPSCSKYAKLPKWMWKCCSEECNELFDAISAYKMGVAEKSSIKDVLDIFEVTDYSKYTESIQNTLNELFPNKQNKNKKRNKNVEEVMDIELKEETTDENLANDIVADMLVSEIDGISVE